MYLSNGVSVIIPTYNRAELLNLTLKSLQLQTCDRNNYEVIVIDDGSIDDTKGIVTSFGDSLDVHYLHQEHQGFRVARARNLGIASARFNVCLFLDSGMLAAPELIDIHLNAHIRYAKPIAYVGYANGFDEFNESSFSSDFNFNSQVDLRRVFQGVSKRHEYMDCRIMGLQKLGIDFDEIKIPWLLFWTCHASCSTTALRAVNGFDEVFQSWGGEDVELAIRLHKEKVKIAHLPQAPAIHLPHYRSTEDNKVSSHLNCQYIYRKHPSIETQLLASKNQSWEMIISSLHAVVAAE